MVTIFLGPNLSLSLPERKLRTAEMIMLSEKGAEVAARDQPNSSSMGLKKTPKLSCEPTATTMMKKLAMTMM
jgi:hypothetical protein